MELGTTHGVRTDTEPVQFDVTTLADFNQSEGRLKMEFQRGAATFGNEIYDAVAMSNGIDAEGYIDMAMVAAVEQTAEYLEDKQGQPVIFADYIYIDGKLGRIDAMVGILADDDKLVGAFRDNGSWRNPGIKLNSDCYELSASTRGMSGMTLERSISMETNTMPLSRREQTIGRIHQHLADDNSGHAQEIIAGADIMPWLAERFDDNRARYEIFRGIAKAIQNEEAAKFIMQSPYTDMVRAELTSLSKVATVLGEAARKISQHQTAIEGAKAAASLELQTVREEAGELAYRFPYTSDSYRTNVTEAVGDLDDVRRRLQTIERLRHLFREAGLIV